MANKQKIILDRGHGTLNEKGVYVTPGKRYTYPDGLTVYEGVENAKYVKALAKKLECIGFEVIYTIHPDNYKDMSLADRVKLANTYTSDVPFISIHNNAANGKAIGTEIFTSIGKTPSDTLAEYMYESIRTEFPKRALRMDMSDGDMDKEANFYVLTKTKMPAVLVEVGFFDTRADYEWLSNEDTIDRFCTALAKAILRFTNK